MKINGIKVEMDHCLKNHVYLVDDKTRSVYYFDDNEKLNSIPEWEAVPLLKNGILTGMRREQYSPGIYLWHPEVQLDKIEKAAILTSQVRNGMNGCSFKRIKQKIAYGRKTGSIDLPDQSKRPWSPKTKKSLLNSEFDLERFITKIDRPTMERDVDNHNTKTFDFIRMHMYILTYETDPMNIIKTYKKDILMMALDRIEQTRSFKRYGIPINFLKLDKFTYCDNQKMIELLFVLKPISGGLVELS